MKTELATFSAAPLDRTARVVTRGIWLLALALAVTSRDRVVLLDVGESAVAVSPEEPEAFIAEVERAA